MAYETIIVDIEDNVATITLNRPDALNALNRELLQELCNALEDADANDKVRCIILTGSEKAFAAGADVKEMAEQSFVDMFFNNSFDSETNRFNRIRKPIIGARRHPTPDALCRQIQVDGNASDGPVHGRGRG